MGGGLVTWVTPPVKPPRLRTMRLDVFSTPPTIEAAKAAPGKVGMRRPKLAAEARAPVPAALETDPELGRAAPRVQGR